MGPEPDEHERALFREATRGVKPLRAAPRVTPGGQRPRARAPFVRAVHLPELAVMPSGAPDEPPLAAGDKSCFARPGVSATTLRALRRGEYRVQAELDLHGLTLAVATRELQAFLNRALQRKVRCLRIVHGKGLRSGPQGPVLRSLVNRTLRHLPAVLAFASAPQAEGGTGALYVLLAVTHASSASTPME